MRGDGKVFQRGNIWHIRYFHRGKKIRETSQGFVYNGKPSDGTSKRAAEKMLQERRRTAGTAQFIGPQAERVTFKHLADLYLTDYKVNGRRSLGEAERAVRHLRGAFGLDRAVDITAPRIAAYTAARLAEQHKPATINREIAALRRMFNLAVRAELLPRRPHIALLAEENTREGFLEPSEFKAALNAKNKAGRPILVPCLQDALLFLYLTAWRIGALRALEWRDVHLEWKGGRVVGGTVQLRAANAKNKRGKVLPLRGELVAILERRAADRRLDCVHVFHRTGRPLVSFRKAWRAACTAAGLAGVLVHDLRRSAARNALRTRKTHERVVMELGGWRTRSVFDRYNITSEEDLANAVEAISDYVDEHGSERPTVEPLHGTGGSGPGDGSRRG